MLGAAATPAQSQPFPQDAAQSHPVPPVQGGERPAVAVLELFKPAPQRPFTSVMIARRLWPEVRFVFARMASLSFVRLLARGQRWPRSNR